MCFIIGLSSYYYYGVKYNTRYGANQNFFKPSLRPNYGISTLKFSTMRIWESVPPEFKRLPYMLFKKQYKRFLLGTQY